jgi:hypothetical protein
MRFLYRRLPSDNKMDEDIKTVLGVLTSDVFIFFDLFIFTSIITLLVSPKLSSLFLSILVFLGVYSVFTFIHLFILRRVFKDRH